MNIIIILILLFFSGALRAQNNECKIVHTLVNSKGSINTNWLVFIEKNKGIIKLDGILNEKSKRKIISREISFRPEKISENIYHFTSEKIKKNPAENISQEEFAIYYPDFFQHENKTIIFILHRAGNVSVMGWTTEPMFICY